MLTSREVYIYGWTYGRVERVLKAKWAGEGRQGKDIPLRDIAQMRPQSSSAQIIAIAAQEGILTGLLDRDIAVAFSEIRWLEEGTPEPVLPLELQGTWQLGYYHAKAGNPLPPPADALNIAGRRRAKKLSQAKLAELVGVTQTQISRWELGKDKVPADKAQKLEEVLQ